MFGLPTAVVSIVCYSICCMEGGDDIAEDDSDLEEEGEERFTSGEISQGETLTNAFIWLLISPCTQDRVFWSL